MANNNSRFNKKTENFFQLLVIGLCAVLVIFGAVSVFNAFTPRDSYEKVNLDYKIGEIVTDSTGAGIFSADCKTALVSEDAVRCTSFTVEAQFDPVVAYEVHFYTDDNVYVGYASKAHTFYHVPAGQMPVLKSYVGDIESDEYKNATAVLDADGNEQVATNIRIVIRASSTNEDIFDNVVTKWRVENSVTVKATAMPAADKTVSADPTEASSN